MKTRIGKFCILVAVVAFVVPFLASAQTRSYYYESISQKFTVNKDTTVDVEETQTYRFNGEYHQGWRSIPLNKVSDITDVEVFDGSTSLTTGTATPLPLVRVYSSLDKTNPTSWGKYHVSRSGGSVNIEWYYGAKDESRSWILKYKLIGALSFLKDKDELYWNLFTDYDVPVQKADATVTIPGNTFSPSDLQSAIYLQSAFNGQHFIQNNRTFVFSADNIAPRGIVTIAAGFPKDLIDRGAFWRTWLLVNWWWIVSILIVIATIVAMILYWYFTEKRGKGRGTIVPEYEPPRKLPPAMAEVIVREKITPKGWAATVVDLAVKGYLKITEEPVVWWSRRNFSVLFTIIFLAFFIYIVAQSYSSYYPLGIIYIIPVIFIFLIIRKIGKTIPSIIPKDYVIERLENRSGAVLQDYEKKFLDVLVGIGGGRFSTKEMRKDPMRGRMLYGEMNHLKKELYQETEVDTGAYEKPLSKDNYSSLGIFLLLFAVFMIPAGAALSQNGTGYLVPLILLALCALSFWLFAKFEARLSAEGAILREEWLGFKLYLETAEKYRMQNLTPETFEKYLPYAIIFGVEKQWGKAFEGISMPPPSWYSSQGVAAGAIMSGENNPAGFSSNFSASAFSASFASSFTSAFSSSGGAGASGGGGGAGGGGGGGGGGAS